MVNDRCSALFLRCHQQLICTILGLAFIFVVSAAGQEQLMLSPVVGDSSGRDEYRVSSGDILHISVWGQESLSGSVTVGPDGAIILPPPVGSVYVNQLTASEITELLTNRLEEYMRQPVVTVSIRTLRAFRGFMVHILGQVQLPSFYQVPDGTSVQELITRSGGFTRLADPRSIILIRKEGEKIEKREIDFSRFLKQNDMESNPTLKADDVVVVSRMDMEEKAKQLVTIVGQVGSPGSYELEAPIPLLDVLALADGVLGNADLRSVFILSRSEIAGDDVRTPRKVDLEAILSGANNQYSLGPTVSPGQIVFIPNIRTLEERTFSVNVIGQVTKPGYYPVTEKTRLIDAIFKAGGFTEEAAIDNISIIHAEKDSHDGSTVSLFSLRDYLLTGDIRANPELHEGDTVVVPLIETAKLIPPVQTAFSSTITVSVMGEVAKPGVHQISAKSSLFDLLTSAGSMTSSADLKKIMIVRGAGDAGTQSTGERQRIRIDLEKIMAEGDLDLLPVMFSGDTVFVPKLKESDWWRTVVQVIADTSSIALAYYIISGQYVR